MLSLTMRKLRSRFVSLCANGDCAQWRHKKSWITKNIFSQTTIKLESQNFWMCKELKGEVLLRILCKLNTYFWRNFDIREHVWQYFLLTKPQQRRDLFSLGIDGDCFCINGESAHTHEALSLLALTFRRTLKNFWRFKGTVEEKMCTGVIYSVMK